MDYTRVSRRGYGRVLNYLFLSAVALICIIPIVWLVYTSFKPRMLTFASPPVWLKFKPTLENYRRVIQEKNLVQPLLNSVIIVTSSTAIAIAIGSFAAYIFSRHKRRWTRPALFAILTTNMIPMTVILLPIFLFARKVQLYDTRLMLIIVYIAYNLAFVIWMLRSFFLDIPAEVEESALIDGCNRLGVVFRIVLPLSAPAIAATAILAFIFSWNNFLFSLIIAGFKTRTLPIAVYNFLSYEEINWGGLTAAATIITLPVLVLSLFIQKHIVRGLTLGALKG
jgi:multiple sugar transport system permease protein